MADEKITDVQELAEEQLDQASGGYSVGDRFNKYCGLCNRVTPFECISESTFSTQWRCTICEQCFSRHDWRGFDGGE